MIPEASHYLDWLEKHPYLLKGIKRGLERETLRINETGILANTKHPKSFGSPLTHKWISTDFSEALLEFITPVNEDIKYTLSFIRDLHRHVAYSLKSELMWSLSMPCCILPNQEIQLAEYGTSNIGRLKHLYRKGLKNRYGALMQTVSGVHYNFSLPKKFWKEKYKNNYNKLSVSEGYLVLIRNYYRFGWIIPYLFGASPTTHESLIKKNTPNILFEKTKENNCYSKYATSLRLSHFGCTNDLQKRIKVSSNSLHEYVAELQYALKTPSEKYKKIGLKRDGQYLQINTHILQKEDELYAPIRPRCNTRDHESYSDALLKLGIEYIEVRSLDINPFSPIGIDEKQILFLDIFMIWCALAQSTKISDSEVCYIQENWQRVILQGRKPGLKLFVKNCQKSIPKIGKSLFFDLRRVARILDSISGSGKHQDILEEFSYYLYCPELTASARILPTILKYGIKKTGKFFSTKYKSLLLQEKLEVLTIQEIERERNRSLIQQKHIEQQDKIRFSKIIEENSNFNF